MTGRDSTVPIANDFFLLAHDDVTGKPRLHPKVAGIGLASALLDDLMLYGWVDVRAGVLLPATAAPIPEPLLERVFAPIRAERPAQSIRTWLDSLSGVATDGVPARLAEAGILVAARSWGLRRTTRWVPADISAAAWPAARVRLHLVKGGPMTLPDVLLAGLAVACGLDRQVLWDAPPRARQYLDHLRANLPGPLRELLAETESAVGDAVLTRRV